MKTEKLVLDSHNNVNKNKQKNFIPRPHSKRDNNKKLLLFNKPKQNKIIKLKGEEEDMKILNLEKIRFNKRMKSTKEENIEIKLPKISFRNNNRKISKKEKSIIKLNLKISDDKLHRVKTDINEEKINEFPEKKLKLKLNINNDKNSLERNERYNNKKFIKNYYKIEKKNCRKEMEDIAYTNINYIEKKEHKISLFAIYDGHNGKYVSEYLNKNFDKILYSNLEKNNYLIEKSINDTFKEINTKLENLENTKTTGSTATIILIDNNILYCVNIGDSQCYYITKDNIYQLTYLHNCNNKKEIERIKKSNGMIFQNRVFGSLSLTKSFGDTDFKNYGVNAIPNITKEVLMDNYSKYIILGSDGIWDVINQNHLKNILDVNTENSNFNSKNFCEKIVHNAIKLGSQDNISCVVIKL